jgi:hypothetical protein
MSKSALYNEALSQPAAKIKCRHCRRLITTFTPFAVGEGSDDNPWWIHVTTHLIVCGDPAADTLHIANPSTRMALGA